MNDSPFLDSDIEALEDSKRNHPSVPFRLPRYTMTCPGCGRGVRARMLEVPHYNPKSKPICASCRVRGAKWYRSPEERAASKAMKQKRIEMGIVPDVGFDPKGE